MSQRRSIPNTPVARRQRIIDVLAAESVRSQGQLERLLAEDGLEVTQATLSRDLDEIGAVKIRDEQGSLVYAVPEGTAGNGGRVMVSDVLPESRLARLCEELLISAMASANLTVVRTPPGAAQFFASALDQAAIDGVIGTIAGDDTLMLITLDPTGGQGLATYLTTLAEGGRRGGDEKVPTE